MKNVSSLKEQEHALKSKRKGLKENKNIKFYWKGRVSRKLQSFRHAISLNCIYQPRCVLFFVFEFIIFSNGAKDFVPLRKLLFASFVFFN